MHSATGIAHLIGESLGEMAYGYGFNIKSTLIPEIFISFGAKLGHLKGKKH